MKYLLLILINFSTLFCQANQSADLPSRTIEGKKYLVYKVQKGDGWNGIAKKFGINYTLLRLANKDSGDKLIAGKELLIPTAPLKTSDPFFNKNYIDSGNVKGKENCKYHIVSAAQTLYGISKIYKVSVDQIKKWNNLTSNNLKTGQKLIVGFVQVSPKTNTEINIQNTPAQETINLDTEIRNKKMRKINVAVPVDESEMDPAGACIPGASSVSVPITNYNYDVDSSFSVEKANASEPVEDKVVFGNGRQEVNEEGLAYWSDETDADQEKYCAYHRTAPAGTIIKVINFTNSSKVYVKVIGTISDAPENEDILIKISKRSAERLGILQKKFQVRLQYGISK